MQAVAPHEQFARPQGYTVRTQDFTKFCSQTEMSSIVVVSEVILAGFGKLFCCRNQSCIAGPDVMFYQR